MRILAFWLVKKRVCTRAHRHEFQVTKRFELRSCDSNKQTSLRECKLWLWNSFWSSVACLQAFGDNVVRNLQVHGCGRLLGQVKRQLLSTVSLNACKQARSSAVYMANVMFCYVIAVFGSGLSSFNQFSQHLTCVYKRFIA